MNGTIVIIFSQRSYVLNLRSALRTFEKQYSMYSIGKSSEAPRSVMSNMLCSYMHVTKLFAVIIVKYYTLQFVNGLAHFNTTIHIAFTRIVALKHGSKLCC